MKIIFILLFLINLEWQWQMSSWRQCSYKVTWNGDADSSFTYIHFFSSKFFYILALHFIVMHANLSKQQVHYSCCSLFVVTTLRTHECLFSFIGKSQCTHHFSNALR
jgi:hypothetical protein